ncbi:MAG: FHA domain-containing protein [Planctomycetes bacterium]|nr:FHA domain-containing protein [Planctomycetota bacterium]
MPLKVTVTNGAAKGKQVNLEGLAVLRIGRAPDNDLPIDDPAISRFHCILKRVEDRWAVFDMGGVNGTVVGGRRIKEHALKEGDLIRLGKTILLFGAPKTAETEPPVALTREPTAPSTVPTPRPGDVKPVILEEDTEEPPPSAKPRPLPPSKPPAKQATTVVVSPAGPDEPDELMVVEDDDAEAEVRPIEMTDESAGPSAHPKPPPEAPTTQVVDAVSTDEDAKQGEENIELEDEEDEKARVETVNKEFRSDGLHAQAAESNSDLVVPKDGKSSGLLKRLTGIFRKKPSSPQSKA